MCYAFSFADGIGIIAKAELDAPELSIDDPSLTTEEKLAKVRVGTLVSEYLRAQELQLLAEGGMSDAIRMFVEKDDIHAIQTYVLTFVRGTRAELAWQPCVEVFDKDVEECGGWRGT